MRQIFYILTVSVLMTSCATIFNRPYKYVTIHTTEPSKIIYKQDTINTIDDKTHLKVERQDAPLSIIVITDSISESFAIKRKNSAMYWSNILFNYGLGMLFERNNPKRYTYPGKIYINSEGATGQYSLYGIANNKGELYLHYSNPIINPFRMMPENLGAKVRTGFMGGTIGLDYYHSKNQFIHLGYSSVDGGSKRKRISDISYPYIKLRENEFMSTDYFSLSNNYKIRRFTVGCGISYAKNNWTYNKTGLAYLLFIPLPIKIDEVKKSHYALGMVFPIYYQIGEYFNFGVVYRPTFFRPNMVNMFVYEHLISIDFAWKIRLMR